MRPKGRGRNIATTHEERRHRYRVPETLLDQIILLATGDPEMPSSRILSEVERMVKAGALLGVDESDLPCKRTVERIARDHRTGDALRVWSLKDSPADDTRVILKVLRAVILATMEKKSSLSIAEAAWVLRVSRLFPEKTPLEVWHLAQQCIVQEAKGASAEALTAFLALMPLRDALAEHDKPFDSYTDRVRGWVAEKEDPSRFVGYRTSRTLPGVIQALHESGRSNEMIAELAGVDPLLVKEIVECMDAVTPKRPEGKKSRGKREGKK